jgi:hypothetical protein
MPRAAERRLAPICLGLALAWPLAAQLSPPPRAPRINEPAASSAESAPAVSTEVPASTAPLPSVLVARRPPNAARLAPLPEQRNDDTEEIVVIGQGWRLPDLGSEWRARQKEAASGDRFVATALPLYDPEAPPLHSDAFTSREQRRHGYIELFRLRFGRRSRD